LRPGGEARVGLGLWNSWTASIVLEVGLFAAGLVLYLRCTRAKDNVGRYGLWALAALLFFGWLSTLFAGAPPDMKSLAWGGLSMWLTVPWGWWVDQHREPRSPQTV
jgi:hypothetical protein